MLRCGEAVSVRTRWDPNVPRERSSQMLFIAESATPRNVVDSVVGLLEGPPCGVDPNIFNCLAGVRLRASV
jgi:hypothetical protein